MSARSSRRWLMAIHRRCALKGDTAVCDELIELDGQAFVVTDQVEVVTWNEGWGESRLVAEVDSLLGGGRGCAAPSG